MLTIIGATLSALSALIGLVYLIVQNNNKAKAIETQSLATKETALEARDAVPEPDRAATLDSLRSNDF